MKTRIIFWVLIFLSLQLVTTNYIESGAFAENYEGDDYRVPDISLPDLSLGFTPLTSGNDFSSTALEIPNTPTTEISVPNVPSVDSPLNNYNPILQSPTFNYNPPTTPAYSLLPNNQLSDIPLPNLTLRDLQSPLNLPLPADAYSLFDTPGAKPPIVNTILLDSHSLLIGKIEKETNVGPATPLWTDSYDNRDYATLPLIICKIPHRGAVEQASETPYSLLERGYKLIGIAELPNPHRILEFYSDKAEPFTMPKASGADIAKRQLEFLPPAEKQGPYRTPEVARVYDTPYPDGVKERSVGTVEGQCTSYSLGRYVIFSDPSVIKGSYYDKKTGNLITETPNLIIIQNPYSGALDIRAKNK